VAASDWRIPLRPDRLLSRRILCDLDGLDLSKPIRLVIYSCLPIQIQRAEVKRRGQLTGVRVPTRFAGEACRGRSPAVLRRLLDDGVSITRRRATRRT
jgi:hypothetical protein